MALLLLTGLCLASALPCATMAQTEAIARPNPINPYAEFIAAAAPRFRVPAVWIRAVLRAESAGDPRAISRKGAIGLMQIMPDTWADLRIRHRLGNDPYAPLDNIASGAAYIRELLDRYGSPGWIAAYNAGPGRYEASLGGQQLPQETRDYVAVVTTAIEAGDATNFLVVAPSGPRAWARAPLFVAQVERRPASDPVPAGRPMSGPPNARSAPDVSAIVPQSGGLFVMRAGERNAP
jgi:Transglycosylase SLT domain